MNCSMCCVLVVENDDQSVASDRVNFSNEDTDSDDEAESDDEREEKSEHPGGEYHDQKRYSVSGASVTEAIQTKAAEKKEPKKQSQVTASYSG